ncbi:hypothetical protein [Virgibacillus salexigens]|uniref:Uncharacterized protein n=1 Tax=Virgibacillus massiliensis TaxID=1462526 RepID=A0A024QDI2_9BACI|nr:MULTISPECIES: hypothetical protein [Virgibacillus]CDQ39976.1 hypothetical protein BN990_02294 [Virgibacillus massiliensis]
MPTKNFSDEELKNMSIDTFKSQLGTEKSFHSFIQHHIKKYNDNDMIMTLNGLLSTMSDKEDKCRLAIAEDLNENYIKTKKIWNQPAYKAFELIEYKVKERLDGIVQDGIIINIFLFFVYSFALEARQNFNFRRYHQFKIGSTLGCLLLLLVLIGIGTFIYLLF